MEKKTLEVKIESGIKSLEECAEFLPKHQLKKLYHSIVQLEVDLTNYALRYSSHSDTMVDNYIARLRHILGE